MARNESNHRHLLDVIMIMIRAIFLLNGVSYYQRENLFIEFEVSRFHYPYEIFMNSILKGLKFKCFSTLFAFYDG